MLRSIPRRLVLAALAAALAAAAALPAAASASAPPRCTVPMLMGELRAPSAGAGQRYATLLLTNATRTTCRLSGFVGGRLLGPTNLPLPTHVAPTTGRAGLVTLTPGQSAKTTLHWAVIPGPGDRQGAACEPTPARIAIYPPSASGRIVLPWRNGPVCERGRIDATPLVHA